MGSADNANPAISNTFIQVYNAQGQVVSASPTGIQVDTNTDTFNSSDQVITLAGGGFAVMWEQLNDTASTEDVFVRIFDASGNVMSAPVLVDVPDDCMQVGQKMIALADGSFDCSADRDRRHRQRLVPKPAVPACRRGRHAAERTCDSARRPRPIRPTAPTCPAFLSCDRASAAVNNC